MTTLKSLAPPSSSRRGAPRNQRQRPLNAHRWRPVVEGLLFSAPALIITIGFTIYPLVQSLILSFSHWDLMSPSRFVGSDNYANLASNPDFRQVLMNTAIYTVGTLVGTYAVALGAALLLNQQLRAAPLVRTLAVIPVLIPMVIGGLIWQWLLAPNTGLASSLFHAATGQSPNWLFDPPLPLISVILVGIWKDFGLYMLVFLITLQGIRPDILEAADMDGATGWSRFWSVTLPMLRPASVFTVTLITFNSLKVFDQVYVMTRGGPGGTTQTLVGFIYQNLLSNIGLASAASIVLFIVALAISILRFRRSGRLA